MSKQDVYVAKMKLQLDELKASAEGRWHKLVSEMEKLRTAFTSSFNYFRSQV